MHYISYLHQPRSARRLGRPACLLSLLLVIAGTSHAEPPLGESPYGLPTAVGASELPSQHLSPTARNAVLEGSRRVLPYIASTGAGGGNLRTRVILSNISDSDAVYSFRWRNANGSLLSMPAGGTLASGSENVSLRAHQSVTISIESQDSARTGWVDLTSSPRGSIVASAVIRSTNGITAVESSPTYSEAWVSSGVTSSVHEQLVLVNPNANASEIVVITFQDGAGTTCSTAYAIAPLGQTLVNAGAALPCALTTDRHGYYRLQGQNGFSGLLLVEDGSLGFAACNFVEHADEDGPASVAPSFGSATISNKTYQVGSAIATATLPAGSGGVGTLTYSLSPSVPGLSFNSATRRLSGTPATAGEYRMTYRVRDPSGASDSLSFVVTVNQRPDPSGGIR